MSKYSMWNGRSVCNYRNNNKRAIAGEQCLIESQRPTVPGENEACWGRREIKEEELCSVSRRQLSEVLKLQCTNEGAEPVGEDREEQPRLKAQTETQRKLCAALWRRRRQWRKQGAWREGHRPLGPPGEKRQRDLHTREGIQHGRERRQRGGEE